MEAHIKALHPQEKEDASGSGPKKEQRTLPGILAVTPLSKPKKAIIDGKLKNYIVKQMVPLSTVEKSPFREFTEALNPAWSPPCTKNIN